MRIQPIDLSARRNAQMGVKMNGLLVLVILAFVWRMAAGYKHGMVKELKAFITFLVSAVSIALICKIVNAYIHRTGMDLWISILFLVVLGIGFKVLKLVFFSAETIAKLPVIHLADKIMGIAMGAVEIVVLLWAFFLVLDMLYQFQLGIFAKMAAAYINDSGFLTFLYDHNILKKLLVR